MTEELVLSLRHVTAGYREGGVLGRKRFHEVLHDVLMCTGEKSAALWENPARENPRWPGRFCRW